MCEERVWAQSRSRPWIYEDIELLHGGRVESSRITFQDEIGLRNVGSFRLELDECCWLATRRRPMMVMMAMTRMVAMMMTRLCRLR